MPRPPASPSPATRIRWIILAFVLLASFISYFVRTNLSVLGDEMIDDLGLTPLQLGYVFSAFAAGYAIFQLPGGMLGDRFGGRVLITVMAIAWFLLTALTGLVPSDGAWGVGAVLASLVVLRFLVGASNAPIFPVTAGGTIANWFPLGGWGLPMGLQVAGLSLGAALSAPLLVWLAELYGWRGALLVTAPAALVMAVVWWWYVRDFPKEHQGVNEAERALIDAGRPPPEAHRERGAWKIALANRDILLLTLSYFCMNYVFYLFFSWFFFYLVEIRQFDNQQAGMFTSAQWILGAIAGLAGGFLCDVAVRKWGVRLGTRWLAIITLLLCSVFLVAGALATSVSAAVILLCLSFGFTQMSDSTFWVAAVAVSGRHGEVATGILNTGGNAVGFVGGMLVPLVAGISNWTVAMASGAVFSLVAAGLWLFVRADRMMDHASVD
jgi:ACS family glucarate transporter-like MFS transporter